MLLICTCLFLLYLLIFYLLQPEPTEHASWVSADCLITYTTEGGSRMVEEVPFVPDKEGFLALAPEGARPV